MSQIMEADRPHTRPDDEPAEGGDLEDGDE
jgi:hypothetical protein